MYIDGSACADMDTALFFPHAGQSLEPALQACARCPVRAECGEANKSEPLGVWAGEWRAGPRSRNGNVIARCPNCKERFAPSRGNRTICSKCAGVESYEEEEPAPDPFQPGVCIQCGKGFEMTVEHKRFCSRLCQRRSQYPPTMDLIKNCEECHAEFKAYRNSQSFCSKDCAGIAKNRARRQQAS